MNCVIILHTGGAFHFYLLPTEFVGTSTERYSVFYLFHSASVFKGVFFWCCSSKWA